MNSDSSWHYTYECHCQVKGRQIRKTDFGQCQVKISKMAFSDSVNGCQCQMPEPKNGNSDSGSPPFLCCILKL